jgi:maleate isomerase
MSLATTAAPLDLGTLESVIDGGLAARLAIGLVVLATDQTLEHEFRELIRIPGVAFYEARVENDNDITPETLRAIGPRIAPTLDLVLPGVRLDVAGFGCTSATMTLGEEYVFGELRRARPGIACTTPVTAAFAAFKALGAKRVGLLTPYTRRINENLARYFERHGVEVAAMATFDRQDDREAARISLDSIEAGAKRLARAPGVECVFVSCTSLRVAAIVENVEGATGVPVTASNHAMAWHCLRLGGVADHVAGAGRLFRLGLA